MIRGLRPGPLADALENFQHNYVVGILTLTNGNVSEAARRAGVSRQHMTRLVARYGLQNPQSRGNWGDLTH